MNRQILKYTGRLKKFVKFPNINFPQKFVVVIRTAESCTLRLSVSALSAETETKSAETETKSAENSAPNAES